MRRAQRYHRQRTLDYIDDLETEIIRLRGLHENTRNGDSNEPCSQDLAKNGAPSLSNMSVSVLVEAFDGQIAPGVRVASHSASVPPYQSPRISKPSDRKSHLMHAGLCVSAPVH